MQKYDLDLSDLFYLVRSDKHGAYRDTGVELWEGERGAGGALLYKYFLMLI